MTIGKRKGAAAQGAGGTGGNKFGGSLSKNDHWYIQQAFGLAENPGSDFSATGGTQIIDGANTYHVFVDHSSPETFVTTGTGQLEILVVGGGGGTGGEISGGGGAGGIAHAEDHTVNAGTHTITVGGGGASLAPPVAPGPSKPTIVGSDSLFGASTPYVITAKGGGGGLMDAATGPVSNSLMNGGSGGGNGDEPGSGTDYYGVATQPTQNPGVPTITNYGNSGFLPSSGNSPANGNKNGGGGGAGSGNTPGSGDNVTGGNGQPFGNFPGPVLAPAIPGVPTWASVVGPTGLFGGGGGGGTGPNYTAGSGGPGGGADAGNAAIHYTGGGAGGGVYPSSPTHEGHTGGRGIVIVRYST